MAAPELRLNVTLDLAAFRTQLGRLAQASAAYYYPVNLQINKKNFEAQLEALAKIKPVIQINDSQIQGAKDRLTTLNRSLATLRRATSTPIEIKVKYKEEGRPTSGTGAVGRAITGRAAGQEALENKSRAELQKIYGLFREANLRVSELSKGLKKSSENEIRDALVPAFSDSGEEAVNGLAIGLKDPSSKVSKAAERLAKGTIQDIKKVFGIASPAKTGIEIGKDVIDGLEIGLGDFNSLRTKMVGEMRQFISALKREAKVGGIALGGLLSPITKPAGFSTRTTPGVTAPTRAGASMDPGRGNQRILNSLSLLTGDPALYRSRMSNLGAGRLPSSLLGAAQNQFDLEELVPSFKQARIASGTSPLDKIIDDAFFGRGTLPKAQSALSTLNNALERLGNAARTALPSGILQSASGRPRMRTFGGVAPSQTMGIFEPTARPTSYPPSGGFLEFSRRATAISAGLPGNVFGGSGASRNTLGGFGGSSPPPPPPPPPPGGGTGGGPGNFASRGGGFGGFNVPNLPGAGLVREIGQEFGFAAKQVLLFGTTYKALGLLQSFPAQVGEAVGQLQSFRNTLDAISPTAQEAAASNQFILDIVDKYNTPLQSARDGFTKLYASMQPAGFSGDEIRDLFLGISQTAATFGMSADKVDRVNYAFAQMASKGQVMSEELKGQLGDVLPGAMAIFAEAAGFKGPEAINKFSKALEDGAYKGAAMKTLLTNVGTIMRQEFGPGAEGAARTFQGVINRMQNSTKLLYETFEPVAVGFLNSVVMPMTNGIKTITDGFNAFFTGQAAKTASGSAFAKQLTDLKPAFDGIIANTKQVLPLLQSFTTTALSLGQVLLQIAGNPFVGYLARIYLSVLPLTIALRILNLQVLIPLIGSFLRAIPTFLAFNSAMASGVSTNKALQLSMQLTGRTASITAGQIRLINAAIATLGTTAILAGIGLIIERFMMLKSAIDGVKQSSQQMIASISGMANAGAVKDLQNVSRDLAKQRQTFAGLLPYVQGGAIGPSRSLTPGVAKQMEDLGMGSLLGKDVFGRSYVKDFVTASQIIEERLKGIDKQAAKVREKLPLAERIAADIGRQAQVGQPAPIPAATGETGDGAGGDRRATKLDTYDRSTLDFIKQQGEQEQLALDRRRQQNIISETRYKIDSAALQLEITRKEEAEKLRLATLATNKDNLSAQDKQLKLTDLQTAYANNLAIAQDKYNVAVEGARKELEGPFNDAIDNANFSIMEQQMLLENIQNGVKELTPDQQAYLEVLRLTTGKSEDELKLLASKSNALRQILEQQIAINKQVEVEQKLRALRDEIKFLRIIGDEERRIAELREEYGDEKAQEIFNLEKIKKNIEDTRALIADFVSSTSSDYKGFLKAVISGEDAADALKQFQEGLKDKVLTIFLDFAMAPVEKFMKEALEGLFLLRAENMPGTEIPKADAKDPVEATNDNTNATNANTTEIKNLTAAIQGMGAGTNATSSIQGPTAGNAFYDGSALPPIAPGFDAGSVFGNPEALTSAFANIQSSISTSMEGIASSFQTGADSLANTLPSWSDALTTKLPSALTASTNNTNSEIPKWQESLGKVTQGIGIAAGAIMGIAAGIGQIKEGGTSNVLGGIGSILLSLGGAIGGFASLFKAANGAVWKGGFTAFANGGMVNGPTLGLVGEGKYNEAIVPLPDGRSIPVQMKGTGSGSLRDAMGQAPGQSSAPILNMSFQSTSINGVEYVSRDQLEAAMAQTRRQASRDGAQRGMTMTLDRIQNSSSTRRRIGV